MVSKHTRIPNTLGFKYLPSDTDVLRSHTKIVAVFVGGDSFIADRAWLGSTSSIQSQRRIRHNRLRPLHPLFWTNLHPQYFPELTTTPPSASCSNQLVPPCSTRSQVAQRMQATWKIVLRGPRPEEAGSVGSGRRQRRRRVVSRVANLARKEGDYVWGRARPWGAERRLPWCRLGMEWGWWCRISGRIAAVIRSGWGVSALLVCAFVLSDGASMESGVVGGDAGAGSSARVSAGSVSAIFSAVPWLIGRPIPSEHPSLSTDSLSP